MSMIFRGLFVIAAVAAVAGAGTYAWQMQQETISGITFSAGSSDLKIDSNLLGGTQTWVDSFMAPSEFQLNNLKPGYKQEQIIDIKDENGAVTPFGTASIRLDLTSNKENSLLSPEIAVGDNESGSGDWNGELAQNIWVKISYQSDNSSTFVEKYNFTLAQYEANPNMLNLGQINSATGIASVKLEWSIPTDASNNIMSDSVGVNVIFGLE